MNTSHPLTVLAVDDDPDFAELTATFLEREGDHFDVLTVSSAIDALEQFSDRDIDCIVSDYEMPGMDGLSFLAEVRRIDGTVPFRLITGKGSEEVAGDAISAGVTDYLQKSAGNEQFALLANKIRNSVRDVTERRERGETVA